MRIRAELRELVADVENLVENCGGITRNLVEHLFYHKFLVKMAGSTVHEGGECVERDRQAKWDGENMATVSTKMRRREYLELRALCVAYHTTPYAVLQHLVTAWMMAAEQTDRA